MSSGENDSEVMERAENETEQKKILQGGCENSKTLLGLAEKPMYKIEMDNVMEKIEVPFRKIKDNLYLVAINSREEIEKAVEKIQDITRVTWSVKQTRRFDTQSNRTLTLFKRNYGCHMATRRRAKTKNIKQKKSRNIDCPAQLIVTIRRYTAHTKSKCRGPLLDEKYPCSFEFRNDHNHRLDAVDVLKTRPLGDETKQAILKLLNKGHTCASAYHTYYIIKVEEFGSDYKNKMTDRHFFPKRNDISTLWKMHNFKEKIEQQQQTGDYSYIVKNLEDILNSYQKKNGTLYRMSVVNETYVICICTPLMQRTVQQVSEILFIDSSSNDIKEHKVYFILTQASVGALPISCVVTNSQSIEAFSEGMRLFFEMIHIQPSIVLTSAEIMQEILVQKYFPSAKIIFSFYHTLKSCWKYLYDARQEIAKGKKESYYQLFRDVVFSDSEEGLVVSRQVLAVECAQQKFLDYVDKMYESINLWCLLYRQYIILRGIETFNYDQAEISFRLFRLISEVPLDRTKLFNVTQMVDFMCSAFEKYYKNRILEMVLCKDSKILKEWYFRKSSVDDLQMEDIGHHQYLFKTIRRDAPEAYYQVDMITNLCTCAVGIVGKHCEHISEVILRCNIFTPLLSVEHKAAYYFVATGVLKHKNSFLPDQEDNLGDEYNIICCSPETILGPEFDTSSDGFASQTINQTFPNYESTKNKWIAYCNQVLQHMEKDPAKFIPAINAHLDNVQKYSTSIPLLLKGLYAGFPYKGDVDKLPPLTIISKSSNNNNNNTNTAKELKHQVTRTVGKNCEPPPLVTIKQEPIQEKSKKVKLKNSLTEDACDSPWNNFSSESSSPLFIDNSSKDSQFSDGISKNHIQILDEKMGVFVNSSEVKEEITEGDIKIFNDKTIAITQSFTKCDEHVLNKAIGFRVDSDQFGEVLSNEATLFDLQKGLYVDQSTLSELSQCEMAVLDEKKGILIIPISQ